MENFTELEKMFLKGIQETWGEQGTYCTYFEEVAYEAKMTNKVARGVLSSLIKKGFVLECLAEYDGEINLTEKGAKLLQIPEPD